MGSLPLQLDEMIMESRQWYISTYNKGPHQTLIIILKQIYTCYYMNEATSSLSLVYFCSTEHKRISIFCLFVLNTGTLDTNNFLSVRWRTEYWKIKLLNWIRNNSLLNSHDKIASLDCFKWIIWFLSFLIKGFVAKCRECLGFRCVLMA